MSPKNVKALLFVISGPSGVGKSTLISRLLDQAALGELPLRFSVSATTRPPRRGEREGDYIFVSEEEFVRRIAANEFLEHAKVYDYRYGTLRKPIEMAMEEGVSVLLDIDVQGAKQIRSTWPDAISIFILPPSMAELEVRLRRRGSEDEDKIKRRLELAEEQLGERERYDYLLYNDSCEAAYQQLKSIIVAEIRHRDAT